MNWFERLVGFPESNYLDTQRKLSVIGGRLISSATDRTYGVGRLEIVSIEELRTRLVRHPVVSMCSVKQVVGDVRQLHRSPENAGALFQVASQFNLLEMVSPRVTPEDGVSRYERDHTQGPACAISAGAAAIYRNYLVPMPGDPPAIGQTAVRQIDALDDFRLELAAGIGVSPGDLWESQNGYVLPCRSTLEQIANYLRGLRPADLDRLRSRVKVGVQWDVECTETADSPGHCVTQVFCSALPIAYSTHRELATWEPFARLVLEAAYEATLLAACLNQNQGGSPLVYLTQLGGGAFGNPSEWINDAMQRAFGLPVHAPLEVRIVVYGHA